MVTVVLETAAAAATEAAATFDGGGGGGFAVSDYAVRDECPTMLLFRKSKCFHDPWTITSSPNTFIHSYRVIH
jgi:hypothetical protein